MPAELGLSLGEKEFQDRMHTLLKLLVRYSWSNMMRMFTISVFVLSFLVVRVDPVVCRSNIRCVER